MPMGRSEPVEPGAPAGGRSDRPLGRGLEDVAHVFLTQAGVQPGAGPDAFAKVGRPHVRDDPGPATVLLRPAAPAGRPAVARALRSFEGALEQGLRMIDEGIPCGSCGEMDFLALDRAARLAVVDFDLCSSDELLVRGLGHLDWVLANEPNLRRMFRGQAINLSLQPRLFLLAPEFSKRLTCAARRLGSLQIELVRYHLVEAPGQLGILFEPTPID